MGSEQFGPFAIDPAWRRRGPTAVPGALEKPAEPAPDVALEKAVPDRVPEKVGPERPAPEPAEVLAPVKVSPPKPEEIPEPPPFKPDPAPEPPVVRKRRRRLRVDLVIPYLAALVGLIALGGAVYLDQQNQVRLSGISAQLGEVRTALDALARQVASTPAPAPAAVPANDGTIDALLALQNRVAALEQTARAPAPMVAPAAAPAAETPAPGVAATTAPSNGPTEDCIPVGTRFVALPGESYPICRTPEVIKLTEISPDRVVVANGPSIISGGSAALRSAGCTLTVISSDAEGFAELKVSCG